MFRKLLTSLREYRTPTILTLVLMVGEAITQTIIPYITANLVNVIKAGADVSAIWETGGVLILMARPPPLLVRRRSAGIYISPVRPRGSRRTCGTTFLKMSDASVSKTSIIFHPRPLSPA